MEKNGTLCGLITDGDIRRVLEKHENISGLIASNVMTQQPVIVDKGMLAYDALRLMNQKNKPLSSHGKTIATKLLFIF